jgi:hypothetical protein
MTSFLELPNLEKSKTSTSSHGRGREGCGSNLEKGDSRLEYVTVTFWLKYKTVTFWSKCVTVTFRLKYKTVTF